MFPQLSPHSTIASGPRQSEPEAPSGRNQSPQSELVDIAARECATRGCRNAGGRFGPREFLALVSAGAKDAGAPNVRAARPRQRGPLAIDSRQPKPYAPVSRRHSVVCALVASEKRCYRVRF